MNRARGCLLLLLLSARLPAQEAAVDPWRESLKYGIESEVLAVIQKIKGSQDDSYNPELVGLLQNSSNPAVVAAVLDCFTESKSRDAEETVLASLGALEEGEEPDPRLAVPRIRYLAAVKSTRAEGVLLRLADARDQGTAGAAVQALGAVGGAAAGERLLQKLRDPEYPDALKSTVIVALGELAYKPALEELLAVADNRDTERVRRMYAAAALGRLGDPRAVPVLRSMFGEADSLVKAYAAAALAAFDLNEVESLLQEGLRDQNARVRLASAKALANKGAQKSVDILIYKARNDPERQVRLQAIQSLSVIGGGRVVEFLRNTYRDPRQANPCREAALAALAELDLAEALPAVRAVVEEEWPKKDLGVMELTARIVAGLTGQGLEGVLGRLLEHPQPSIRLYGLRGVRRNRLAGLREKVKRLETEDPHPAVRREAQLTLPAL